MKLKSIAMTGVLSLAGLGLIGVGAHGVFTQNTTSAQTITAGTMNVTLNSDGGTVVSGWNSANLVLAPVNAYEGSSFVEAYHVIMTNNGNIPVNEITYQLTDIAGTSPASVALQNEMWACLYSGTGNMYGNEGEVYFNSPLTTVTGWGAGASKFLTLAVGATDDYTVVIYAGSTDNGCGSEYDGFSSSGSVGPGYYGQTINGYNPLYAATSPWTPSFGTNPAALSLNNDAEGGVVTPTLTVQFSG
jgi:hypothetical protein